MGELMMTEAKNQRMKWWRDAKFGMFVHWGCYSVLGRGEQIMARDWMPFDEYTELAEKFDPDPDWADQIADQAVRSATMLCTGEELTVEPMRNARWKISGLPETPPCDLAPVIKIEFEAPPYLLTHNDGSWLNGTYES